LSLYGTRWTGDALIHIPLLSGVIVVDVGRPILDVPPSDEERDPDTADGNGIAEAKGALG